MRHKDMYSGAHLLQLGLCVAKASCDDPHGGTSPPGSLTPCAPAITTTHNDRYAIFVIGIEDANRPALADAGAPRTVLQVDVGIVGCLCHRQGVHFRSEAVFMSKALASSLPTGAPLPFSLARLISSLG